MDKEFKGLSPYQFLTGVYKHISRMPNVKKIDFSNDTIRMTKEYSDGTESFSTMWVVSTALLITSDNKDYYIAWYDDIDSGFLAVIRDHKDKLLKKFSSYYLKQEAPPHESFVRGWIFENDIRSLLKAEDYGHINILVLKGSKQRPLTYNLFRDIMIGIKEIKSPRTMYIDFQQVEVEAPLPPSLIRPMAEMIIDNISIISNEIESCDWHWADV